MASIVAGIAVSHVPAIGVAMDKGMTGSPYWEPLFKGYVPAREWLAKLAPDVAIVVYNDHACAFSLEIIPTFLIGVADKFPIAEFARKNGQSPSFVGSAVAGALPSFWRFFQPGPLGNS